MNDNFFRRLITISACLGALGVMIGAFGAHALKTRLSPDSLEILKTGVFYLFIHALAALFVSTLSKNSLQERWLKTAGMAFLIGIVLFSGSLFLLSTATLTGINVHTIGWVTPLGGLCFITGWISLIIWGLRSSKN